MHQRHPRIDRREDRGRRSRRISGRVRSPGPSASRLAQCPRVSADKSRMPRVDSQAAVDWLLRSDEPAIRLLTRRDVLGEHPKTEATEILSGPKVSALLSGQQADGGFGRNPYREVAGAQWGVSSHAVAV